MTVKKTRFGLMRHAETIWNREKRIQGRCDSPLTENGRKQAQRWGAAVDSMDSINWHRIIVSDLERAFQTATYVNSSLALSIHTDSRLREQDWGEWEGKTLSEINREIPADMEAQGWMFRPPEGENRLTVRDRSHSALVDAARRWPGENILTITHEGVIKCSVYGLSGRQFLPTEPKLLKPHHLHLLIHDGNTLAIEKLNAMALT